MDDKKVLISFKGNKKELWDEFKKLAKEDGQTATQTVVQIIEKYIEENTSQKAEDANKK
jgi:predicted DNA-binding protein